ncbi:MAG TPA: hypothetical protein VH764_05110 [Gemmatimonadales bacterium]|jgi:hypothetical protein
MTTMQCYTAAAGLALVLACGDSGERGATAQESARRPPPAPVDACGLLTQEEATAILGTPSSAPEQGPSNSCTFAAQSGRGDIMLAMLPLSFGSKEEFHAFVVKDTEEMNARIKKDLGDAVKPTAVEPVPGVGEAAYYVSPTLVVLKNGRVLSIAAADRPQAVAVAAKAAARF